MGSLHRRGATAGITGITAGRTGLTGIAASIGCFLMTALLGPSAEEPALAGAGPPFALTAHASAYLVIGLVATGITLGALGLGLCLYAVGRGWSPNPKALLIAGLLAACAFAVTPPTGSGDHLNYAAYGRMVVLGHSPYSTSAADLPNDPIASAVQEWRTTKSVYGPIATAQQAFASWIGGQSVRTTVFTLSVTNALAFCLTGLLLYRCGYRYEEEKRRSVQMYGTLLWTLNPLMLFHLVSGAHNDALAIAGSVCALTTCAGRFTTKEGPAPIRAFATGALVGAAAAIKLPAALVGGGPAFEVARTLVNRRGPGGRDTRGAIVRLVALLGGAGIVALSTYALAGRHALDQVRNASKMVSLASPWHLVASSGGRAGLVVTLPRPLVQTGAALVLLALLWLLIASLPPGSEGETERVAAALVLAWLFSTLYILPWYDGLGWAILALPALAGPSWSRFHWPLLAHTTVLSLAYLPARSASIAGIPQELHWLETTIRPTVTPWLLLLILSSLIWRCGRLRAMPSQEPQKKRGHSAAAY